MSKKDLNELNMVSRFVGDFFDGLSKGTADRIIKKAKQKGFPPEVQKQMEKLKKDSDDLDKIIRKYQKKTK
tara:strand:- start:1441 stop:1653 length:213 start_codon:yes stop_codon:yes gene_type:complete